MVSAITKNIKVSVVTAYEADFSVPENNQFFFKYTVLLENFGIETVQLLSREWYIKDSLANVRIVRGEGVVGETPILENGETFEYTSGCEFETPMGFMKGWYIFKNLGNNKQFKVEIPRFIMEFPYIMN